MKKINMLGCGLKIKVLRGKLGLTQEGLAKLLNIPTRRVENWEQGVGTMKTKKDKIIIEFLMKNCNRIIIIKSEN